MAKTQEELNQLKTEYETLTTKLKELTEDELTLVTGGSPNICQMGTDLGPYNDYLNYHYVVGTKAPYVGKWGKVDHYAPMIASVMALYVRLLGESELRLFYPYEVADYTPSTYEIIQYADFEKSL